MTPLVKSDMQMAFIMSFTILSNEPSGSAIGNVYVDGAEGVDTRSDATTTTG